jgi:hypothetical protein
MIRVVQAAVWLLALGISSASSQVVQLPTTHTFSYSGSVWVPDSGSTYLGGVNRSATASRRSLGWHSGGQSIGSSGVVASATIIDLAEMDRQIRRVDIRHDRQAAADQAAQRTEEGKRLVRFARTQFLAGNKSTSRNAYDVAISLLDGRLRNLAIAEYRRVFNLAGVEPVGDLRRDYSGQGGEIVR